MLAEAFAASEKLSAFVIKSGLRSKRRRKAMDSAKASGGSITVGATKDNAKH